jgi:hypothetical protein
VDAPPTMKKTIIEIYATRQSGSTCCIYDLKQTVTMRSCNSVAVSTPHRRLTRAAYGTTRCWTPHGEERTAVSFVDQQRCDRSKQGDHESPARPQASSDCGSSGSVGGRLLRAVERYAFLRIGRQVSRQTRAGNSQTEYQEVASLPSSDGISKNLLRREGRVLSIFPARAKIYFSQQRRRDHRGCAEV